MTDAYQFIDIGASGPGIVVAAFDNQVAYCTASGANVTARVVAALRDLLAAGAGGAVIERVRGWSGAPLADALPLRLAGGIHSLHLSGAEPALAPIYSGGSADDAAIVGAALLRHEAALLPWLDGPPQTRIQSNNRHIFSPLNRELNHHRFLHCRQYKHADKFSHCFQSELYLQYRQRRQYKFARQYWQNY